MSKDWAHRTAQQLVSAGLVDQGLCVVLGACDTGKTILVQAIAHLAATGRAVAIVDADIGQSHIGPPGTVGWAILEDDHNDVTHLQPSGIAFVGDITPARHLLQLTAAMLQSVEQASSAADVVILDTPGFVAGRPAKALWWTVLQILPVRTLAAVSRAGELHEILAGLRHLDFRLENVSAPANIKPKSPSDRRRYRIERFRRYFRNAGQHTLNLNHLAVQTMTGLGRQPPLKRLAALRDRNARDLAVGVVTDWQPIKAAATILAPPVDTGNIGCLVVGDAELDPAELNAAAPS